MKVTYCLFIYIKKELKKTLVILIKNYLVRIIIVIKNQKAIFSALDSNQTSLYLY